MSTEPSTENKPARKRGLLLILLAVLLAAAGWGIWQWIYARHQMSTDNAYVAGNVVQITPQQPGTVVAILADDTDFVQAGQPLVRLDASDARLALEQAQAQLAQTLREVRTLYANNGTVQAQVTLREAELARAQTELARAAADVERRAPLVAGGAVGREEFQHAQAQLTAARNAVSSAQAAVQAAREQLGASRTQTDGTTAAQHPQVQRAAARVREAALALQRTVLPAPVDGHVAKRAVQLGQRVQAGAPLMTLVSLQQLWVDANFKESQLQALRIGQPARMEADVYGSQVVYHGKVVGLGAGTGAAFALLPAQNATGNWIKIVQRVPVRIALDPQDLVAHPLRIGLSMEVTIDTQDQTGKSLADTPRATPLASTTLYDQQQAEADAAVQRVMTAGGPVRPAGTGGAGARP